MRETETKLIPIEQLELWEDANVRKEDILVEIEDLASNIKEIGIQAPLLVKEEISNKKYLVFSGQRRLQAAMIANLNLIPCIVFKNISKSDAQVISLSENLYRQPMNQDDISRATKILFDKYGSITKVASKLGVTERRVNGYLGYFSLPEEVKEKVRNRSVTHTTAVSIYGQFPEKEKAIRIIEEYSKIGPREEKSRFFQSVKKSKPQDSIDTIKARSKELKSSKKIEILLPHSQSITLEKIASNQKLSLEEVILLILNKWIDERSSNKSLEKLTFYE